MRSFLLDQVAEQVDLVGQGLQALTPEGLVGQVDAGDLSGVLHVVDGGGVEHLLIQRHELFALLLVLGVQAPGEQAAEGIGEVVEAQAAAVVVALAQPHIGVQAGLVQTIAIGLLLGLQHQLAQAVGDTEEGVGKACNLFI